VNRRRGLLVDFGGVLTTDVFASFEAFCRAEGFPPHAVRDRFLSDSASPNLLHELEAGRLAAADFETAFGRDLGVAPAGLIDRLLAGMRPDDAMIGAVQAARRSGIRTALLSNSWGLGLYDRVMLDETFDVSIISGEVGMRKPDPAIYDLAVERLGLPPTSVVFVDDLPGNLKPALALGMVTLRHVSAEDSIPALERLLGTSL
jgi:putative hydrolase of the HAD superfamily